MYILKGKIFIIIMLKYNVNSDNNTFRIKDYSLKLFKIYTKS